MKCPVRPQTNYHADAMHLELSGVPRHPLTQRPPASPPVRPSLPPSLSPLSHPDPLIIHSSRPPTCIASLPSAQHAPPTLPPFSNLHSLGSHVKFPLARSMLIDGRKIVSAICPCASTDHDHDGGRSRHRGCPGHGGGHSSGRHICRGRRIGLGLNGGDGQDCRRGIFCPYPCHSRCRGATTHDPDPDHGPGHVGILRHGQGRPVPRPALCRASCPAGPSASRGRGDGRRASRQISADAPCRPCRQCR
mmetsp:Transcript_26733/g.66521  ORF Transcript_26733/g.66521 Transcript_26733/m.66521 type:complete len:248 (-) Transcript_26733:1195-1938(-)